MRPRVALVQPYWDFWEAAVPFDLRPEGRTLRSLDLTITVVNLFSGLDRPLVLEAKLELPR